MTEKVVKESIENPERFEARLSKYKKEMNDRIAEVAAQNNQLLQINQRNQEQLGEMISIQKVAVEALAQAVRNQNNQGSQNSQGSQEKQSTEPSSDFTDQEKAEQISSRVKEYAFENDMEYDDAYVALMYLAD